MFRAPDLLTHIFPASSITDPPLRFAEFGIRFQDCTPATVCLHGEDGEDRYEFALPSSSGENHQTGSVQILDRSGTLDLSRVARGLVDDIFVRAAVDPRILYSSTLSEVIRLPEGGVDDDYGVDGLYDLGRVANP